MLLNCTFSTFVIYQLIWSFEVAITRLCVIVFGVVMCAIIWVMLYNPNPNPAFGIFIVIGEGYK